MVVKSSKILENLATCGQFLTKLLFKRDGSKLWNLRLWSWNHLFKFLEIQVSIDQLRKWLHAGSMHLSHFLVWSLAATVLDVDLIPFFAELDQVLFPAHVRIERSVMFNHVSFSKIVYITKRLFTIPNFSYTLIWDCICCAVDSESWWSICQLFEKHSSHKLLIIWCFSFSSRHFHILDHLPQSCQIWLVVSADI